MATISLCMIVKDEELTLERCLQCAKGFADEIVVVDTGSVDRTKEIAKNMRMWSVISSGVRTLRQQEIFLFPKPQRTIVCGWMPMMWCRSRNRKNRGTERKLTETKADVVMMPYDVAFDAGGKPTFSYFRERIVKNTGRPLWEGRVHEVITPYGNILHEDIHVEHRKEKAYDTDRNLLIYEKMRAEGCVFSPREQFYYARELYYHGRYGEAIDEFRVFMGREGAWLENKLEACRQMAVCYGQLQKPQEQLEALFYSFTLDLPRAETCCDLGRYYFDRQAWREAAFWYETALRVEKRKNGGGFIREDCYGYLPCIQLCVCYDRLGRREKAVSYNEMAAVFKPEDRAVAYNRAYFANVSKG